RPRREPRRWSSAAECAAAQAALAVGETRVEGRAEVRQVIARRDDLPGPQELGLRADLAPAVGEDDVHRPPGLHRAALHAGEGAPPPELVGVGIISLAEVLL